MLTDIIQSIALRKQASASEFSTEFAKFSETNPLAAKLVRMSPYVLTGGLAGILAGGHLLNHGINYGTSTIGLDHTESFKKNPDSLGSKTLVDHPYLSNLGMSGAHLALAPTALGGIVMGLGQNTVNSAVAPIVKDRIKKKDTSGVLGGFTYRNPRLGSALSTFIPGLSVNRTIAGERLAEDAINNPKSFRYNHPHLAALAGSLIPFTGLANAHAAAKIQAYKNEKSASYLPIYY